MRRAVVNSLRVLAACLHRKGIRALVPNGWRVELLDGQLELQLHSRVLVIESMRTPHALVTDRGILTKSPAMLGLRRAKFPRDGPCAVAADGFAQPGIQPLRLHDAACGKLAANCRTATSAEGQGLGLPDFRIGRIMATAVCWQ
jgi:hypothetical protein